VPNQGNEKQDAPVTPDKIVRKLSEHFTLTELTRHDSSPHLDNTPSPAQIVKLCLLAQNVLEPIRAHWGRVRVHSGYRSPQVNVFVHGSRASQHMKAEAADISFMELYARDLNKVARWIATSGKVPFDQLILEFVSEDGLRGWLHVSHVTDRKNRGMILIASRDQKGNVVYRAISAAEIPTSKVI
jgi:zinc D-Ala-D-Ala carboxypeptidase